MHVDAIQALMLCSYLWVKDHPCLVLRYDPFQVIASGVTWTTMGPVYSLYVSGTLLIVVLQTRMRHSRSTYKADKRRFVDMLVL